MTLQERPAIASIMGAHTAEEPPGRLRRFTEIEVVPPNELYFCGILVDGGPIWPDFDTQGPVRFNRVEPVDHAPKPRTGPHRRIDKPCVWGGFIQRHFGHLVADHLTRIVESLMERPDDLFLFVSYPGGTDQDIPGYFWSVIEWLGLRRDQVMIVREPLIVAELRCAPQAEQLEQVGPSQRYLACLDATTRRNGFEPKPDGMVYVSRVGMLKSGKGGHAGERYLVSVLSDLGVSVLDPAKAPLRKQLEAYAGARTLIFAEGSALHGRQLLGHIPQDIIVLNRRVGQDVARHNLEPRCRSLRYCDVVRAVAIPKGADGRELDAEAVSFYETEALFDTFESLGVRLRGRWTPADFRKSEAEDTSAWLRFSGAYGRLSDLSRAALGGPFAEAGLDDLLKVPVWTRADWQLRSQLLRLMRKIVRARKPWSN